MNSHSLQTLGPGIHPVLHGASKVQLPEGQLFIDMAEQRILGCELSLSLQLLPLEGLSDARCGFSAINF